MPRSRFARRAFAAAAVSAAVAAGCGEADDGETPAACRASGSAYLTALAAAPDQVRLSGDARISDCLVVGQSPAALQEVGSAMVDAAADLNRRARRDPVSPASVRLGYLVGAIERGAEGTGGIHADLVRRVNASARFSPDGALLPAEFERAFGRGYAAGRESG